MQGVRKVRALKEITFFIIFELVFCTILGIYLVFYGPFTKIKETFVTSAMTTLNHKYLATWFLSDEEIKEIMEKNKTVMDSEEENQDDIVINENGSNNVELVNIETNKFKGYLLIVENPERVKIGTAQNLGKEGMTLGQIVKRYGAQGGVNAGGFADDNMTGTGGVPSGIIIENYQIKYQQPSIDEYNIIGFNDKNVLIIGKYTLDEIKEMKIRDAISFGPALIINGKPLIKKGDGGWGIAPRTAIGQRKDGTILLLVIDGRQKSSIGATLKDVQNVLLEYGAYNAANLDGGSSTTMYYNGNLINSPSDILGERAIPSAFIIKGDDK
jgi:exopolysaccharide biosynthesis protein